MSKIKSIIKIRISCSGPTPTPSLILTRNIDRTPSLNPTLHRTPSLILAILVCLLTGEPSIAADHWSFIPPARVSVPRVKEALWVGNPIDAFILDKLEERGLAHAPEADRAALL